MATILFIGAIVIVAVALLPWIASDFFKFVAPDNADREEIERRLGKGTPEAEAALARRFGKNRVWYDAATGVCGLLGLATLYWILFG